MKKIILSKLILLIQFYFCFEISAQSTKVKVVYSNLDSTHCNCNIPLNLVTNKIAFEELQKKLDCFDTLGNKIKILPKGTKEISFSHDCKPYRMLSVPTISKEVFYDANHNVNLIESKPEIFLLLVEDGKLQMFKYFKEIVIVQPNALYLKPNYQQEELFTSIKIEEKILFKRQTEIFNAFNEDKNFNDYMSFYFSDCPALSNKIESKEFNKEQINEIVKYYNSQCIDNVLMSDIEKEKMKNMKIQIELQKISELPNQYTKIKYDTFEDVQLDDLISYIDYNNVEYLGVVKGKPDNKKIEIKFEFPSKEVVQLKHKSIFKIIPKPITQ